LSAVLGLFVHLAPAMADEVLDRARSLAKQNNPKAALELLLPLEGARAGDIEYDYLLGITALDAGDPQQAVFALERVLAVNPNYLQARAEIARAYTELGERENAKREFRNVLSGNPPDAVKQTIDRLLSTLIANGRRLSGFLEFGYGTDSNVNSATASGQVALPALGGGLVTLGPGGSRLGDNFSSVSAGANLLQPLSEEWALAAGVAASARLNNTDKQFDTNSLDGNIGARWSRDKNAVSAAFQAQTFSVDNTRFRDTTGIVAQWQHSYSDTRQITAYTQLSDLRYPTQSIRDARRGVYGLSYAEGLGGPRNIVLFGSIYGGQERETAQGVQHLGHKLVGARLGGQLDIGAKSQLFASLGGEQRHYGGQEPLYLTPRKDGQLDVRVGVNYTFMPTWVLTPQISYTDNQSNIATSKFSRSMASVLLRKDF
jgi:tetratricopeptide (TPR) repeat protein